jgi:hypothetical protein
VYTVADTNTYPFPLYYNVGGASNTIAYALTATGQPCASGDQTFLAYFTLSAFGLSATNAGPAQVGITNQQQSFNGVTTVPVISSVVNVWCINQPFPVIEQTYFCIGEFSRIQQFLG